MYCVGKVWEENQLIVERINRNHATTATVLSAVMTAAVASFGKKGREANKALSDLIKELNGNG
ncbi:hypothetical protein D3C80_2116060 [compost metagenome]